MGNIFSFLIFQVLDQPALFLGLIAMVGLLLQKKKASAVFDGVIKTIVGLTVLGVGADIVGGSMSPLIDLLNKTLQINGVLPANEAAFAIAMETLASDIVLCFIIGFFLHLLLVRLIPNKTFKNVYLTVHMMLIVSSFLNVSFPSVIQVGRLPKIGMISVLLALYWTLGPALARIYSKSWTGETMTLGHANATGTWLSSKIGDLVGKPEEDAENLKLPGFLSIFKDTTLSIALIMTIIFIVLGVLIGPSNIKGLAGDVNWVVYLFLQAIKFTAGFVILMNGVRMFIGSLVPAFKGISDKFLPGAIPALDVPVFYPFSQMGAMFGFLGSIAGTVLFLILSFVVRFQVWVFPSPIIMFFDGCLMGVFANKRGGWKAAILAGLVAGFITHLGFVFLYPLTSTLYGSGITYSNLDYALIWLPLLLIIKFVGGLFGLAV